MCFTKDGAYLEGVMIIHLFIRKVLQEGRGDLLPMLFVGRLTTADVVHAGAVPRQRLDRAVACTCRRGRAIRNACCRPWRSRLPRNGCAWTRFDLQRFVDYEDEVIAESGIGGGS